MMVGQCGFWRTRGEETSKAAEAGWRHKQRHGMMVGDTSWGRLECKCHALPPAPDPLPGVGGGPDRLLRYAGPCPHDLTQARAWNGYPAHSSTRAGPPSLAAFRRLPTTARTAPCPRPFSRMPPTYDTRHATPRHGAVTWRRTERHVPRTACWRAPVPGPAGGPASSLWSARCCVPGRQRPSAQCGSHRAHSKRL